MLLLLLFLIGGLWPVVGAAQPHPDSLRALLKRQLDHSHAHLQAYEKTVEHGGQRETQRYTPQPDGSLKGLRNTLHLTDELEPALRQVVFDPRLRGEFQIVRREGTWWQAKRKPNAAPTQLVEQTIWYDNRYLRRIRSRYHHDSFLYDVRLTIDVEFDAQGRYHHHTLSEQIVIDLLDIDFQVRISGQGRY